VLQANFMQPVIQATNNMLVVDTDASVSLSTPALVRKSSPFRGSFPGLERTCAGPESRRRA